MIAHPEGPSFISRTVRRSCMDQLNARDTRPSADEVRDGILHRFTFKCEGDLIEPASYASGQLMRDLVGRYVVLQAAGVAQKALQHAGSAHCART